MALWFKVDKRNDINILLKLSDSIYNDMIETLSIARAIKNNTDYNLKHNKETDDFLELKTRKALEVLDKQIKNLEKMKTKSEKSKALSNKDTIKVYNINMDTLRNIDVLRCYNYNLTRKVDLNG